MKFWNLLQGSGNTQDSVLPAACMVASGLAGYCRNVPKLINDPNVSCDCPWGQQQGNADDPPFSCSCNPGHPLSVGVQCGVGAVRSGGGAVVAA